MSEKLKIKSSIVPTERPSFNEWVQEKNVSGLYIEPTQFYQGNSTTIGMMYDQDFDWQSPTLDDMLEHEYNRQQNHTKRDWTRNERVIDNH